MYGNDLLHSGLPHILPGPYPSLRERERVSSNMQCFLYYNIKGIFRLPNTFDESKPYDKRDD